jgi:hypothetical protein
MDNVDPAQIPLADDGFIPTRDIKLLPFWHVRTAAWLAFVESRFRLLNNVDKMAKFDHMLSALPDDMVGQILDIVEAGPPVGDTLPVQLREVEHAAEDGADRRKQTIQAAGGHDGFLSCGFGAVSSVPLPLPSEVPPGLEDTA